MDVPEHGVGEAASGEQELRASEARYRALFENATDIVYTHDLAGNFVDLNSAGERITGYPREEARRMNVADVVAPDCLDLAREMIARKTAGGGQTTYDLAILAKDGRRIDVEVSTQLVWLEGQTTAILGIARDVTERKQLEEQIRQAQKMEAVGRLAGGVAHDFNNLLTIINGYAGLLARRLPEGDPNRADAEEVRKAGERAARLTRQLLAFSRKQMLKPAVLDLNRIVADMEGMLRRLVGEDVALELRLAPDLPRIRADAGQLEQVVMNLVVNARDAMPAGGALTIETAGVRLSESYTRSRAEVRPGLYAVLAVTDTGEGIEPGLLDRIFEPFFTTKGARGTGLGLSTVYGIVRQSGGSVFAYSEPGHGAVFKVYLPAEAGAAGDAASSETAAPAAGARATETILLAEDDDGVRRFVAGILAERGYTVLAAANGPEALELCASHPGPIDLLLSDVVMPQMGGPELHHRVEPLRPGIKVLFMSGYTEHVTIRHGVREGLTAFIEKPFTPEALEQRVRAVLDG